MGDQQDAKDGVLDLEKELSCSICTDVFYQPLTLLDCLHTFCGSCLKEWFSWQASAATSEHPYTCPACRAAVRGTKPNATVTTLLDILLRAHPEKGKSLQERDEIEKGYRPGDNVIPPVSMDYASEDSEDERLLQNARELSLHDMDSTSSPRSTSSTNAYARHRRRHGRDSDREGDRDRGTHFTHRPEQLARAQQPSPFIQQTRQLDHQSSLRSLLSASEPDSLVIQEEIMQQIIDDGLLDGIDLNNLTPAQEEDITERIAHAFRSRQRHRERHRRRPSTLSRPASTDHRTRASSTSQQPALVHPPLSRPHLLDDASHHPTHRRQRTSSQPGRVSPSSTLSTNRPNEPLIPAPVTHHASRSATDLSQRTHQSLPLSATRISHNGRRVTDPDYPTEVSSCHPPTARPSHRVPTSAPHFLDPAVPLPSAVVNRSVNPLLALRSSNRPSNSSSPALVSPYVTSNVVVDEPRPVTSSAVLDSLAASSPAIPIPSVSCSRCEKSDIQSSLHYRCSQCHSGHFNLCLSCYRAGKGCLQWHGFGHAAFTRYQKQAASETNPLELAKPHILSPRRYQPRSNTLEEGLFCEGCFAFADDCYWHCDICNDGAWGFCKTCVQMAKHCTHPLQCIGSISGSTAQSHTARIDVRGRDLCPAPLKSTKAAFHFALSSHALALSSSTLPSVPDPSLYTTLELSVYCDVCHRSVPPIDTRLHCHFCNDGDYDVCFPCYHSLVGSGKIRQEDGPQGWRRCPRGHRMSVVGFEDREGGTRRLVVKDIVGGWALREDGPDGPAASQVAPGTSGQWKWKEDDGTSASQTSTTRNLTMNMMPPDGGVGLRTQALWSHFPADGVRDELVFPRNGVVTEVENINGDWYWGVYAGRKGLFPGNYVRIT